jgi:hypothetical protein
MTRFSTLRTRSKVVPTSHIDTHYTHITNTSQTHHKHITNLHRNTSHIPYHTTITRTNHRQNRHTHNSIKIQHTTQTSAITAIPSTLTPIHSHTLPHTSTLSHTPRHTSTHMHTHTRNSQPQSRITPVQTAMSLYRTRK